MAIDMLITELQESRQMLEHLIVKANSMITKEPEGRLFMQVASQGQTGNVTSLEKSIQLLEMEEIRLEKRLPSLIERWGKTVIGENQVPKGGKRPVERANN